MRPPKTHWPEASQTKGKSNMIRALHSNIVSAALTSMKGCFFFLLLFTAVPTLWAASDRHVVVVCIDGFASYLLDDPRAPVPTLRKLAKEGAVAEGGMEVSNQSITWP